MNELAESQPRKLHEKSGNSVDKHRGDDVELLAELLADHLELVLALAAATRLALERVEDLHPR
jgi:hypothetical protein